MDGIRELQLSWRRQKIHELIMRDRAIKPHLYESYGVKDGMYKTPEGDLIDVEAFYSRLEELVYNRQLEAHDAFFGYSMRPGDTSIRKHLQRLDMQLVLLRQILLGNSEFGIVFCPDLLAQLLASQGSDDYEDFVKTHDAPTPLTEHIGEDYVKLVGGLYHAVSRSNHGE